MKLKKIFCLMFALLMTAGCTFALSGCGAKDSEETSTAPENTAPVDNSYAVVPVNPGVKNDTENKVGYQLDAPKEGDEIAIIHTTMGDIKLRLFPENAPKTVENFVTLAKEGTYDGTIFHRVIDNFMIQTGDYEYGNGTGGKSIFGDKFEDEFCNTLYNIRGSVAMANSGVNTNGSQFFINQAGADKFNMNAVMDYDTVYNQLISDYNSYVQMYGTQFTSSYPTVYSYVEAAYKQQGIILSHAVTDEVKALYEANGGNIHLDGALRAQGGHTVFAQVIEGMDVVDAIAGVKVDSSDKPATDVLINTIEITTY